MDHKEYIQRLGELVSESLKEQLSADPSQIRIAYTPERYVESGRELVEKRYAETNGRTDGS